jgi:hypothetical protein
VSEVHESDEYEIPGNEGRPDIVVMRLNRHRSACMEDNLLEMRDMLHECGMKRSVVCVMLYEDEDVEVWEIED